MGESRVDRVLGSGQRLGFTFQGSVFRIGEWALSQSQTPHPKHSTLNPHGHISETLNAGPSIKNI